MLIQDGVEILLKHQGNYHRDFEEDDDFGSDMDDFEQPLIQFK